MTKCNIGLRQYNVINFVNNLMINDEIVQFVL